MQLQQFLRDWRMLLLSFTALSLAFFLLTGALTSTSTRYADFSKSVSNAPPVEYDSSPTPSDSTFLSRFSSLGGKSRAAGAEESAAVRLPDLERLAQMYETLFEASPGTHPALPGWQRHLWDSLPPLLECSPSGVAGVVESESVLCNRKNLASASACQVFTFGRWSKRRGDKRKTDLSLERHLWHTFGCKVNVFDASATPEELERVAQSSPAAVFATPFGLATTAKRTKCPKGEACPHMLLADIKRRIGFRGTRIHVLRIDVGEDSWAAVPFLLRDKQLCDVDVGELHVHFTLPDTESDPSVTPVMAARPFAALARCGFVAHHRTLSSPTSAWYSFARVPTEDFAWSLVAPMPVQDIQLHEPVADSLPSPVRENDALMIMGIISRDRNLEDRRVVRETWLRWSSGRVVWRFVLGYDNKTPPHVKAAIEREQEAHGDLLILDDLEEAYGHLPHKTLLFYDWVYKFVDKHDISDAFVMKTDDDVFLQLDVILSELETAPKKGFWWTLFRQTMPYKVPGHKWYEPDWDGRYPPFPSGAGHIMSLDLALWLGRNLNNPDKIRLYSNEDVSLAIIMHQQKDVEFEYHNDKRWHKYPKRCDIPLLSTFHGDIRAQFERSLVCGNPCTCFRTTQRVGRWISKAWSAVIGALSIAALLALLLAGVLRVTGKHTHPQVIQLRDRLTRIVL